MSEFELSREEAEAIDAKVGHIHSQFTAIENEMTELLERVKELEHQVERRDMDERTPINRDLLKRYVQLINIAAKDPGDDEEGFQRYQTAIREIGKIDEMLSPLGLAIDYVNEMGIWCIQARPPLSREEQEEHG